MMERSVPWWRRALAVALDGIRSGFGLFRRNGKAAAGTEFAAQAGSVAQPREAERDETEAQKEESLVKPTSPQSEAAVAKEVVAPKSNVQPSDELSVETRDVKGHVIQAADELCAEPQNAKGHDFSRAETAATDTGALAPEASLAIADSDTPLESEATEEPAAPTPTDAGETTQVAKPASAEAMTELLEVAVSPAPEEAAAPDPEPPPATEPPTVPDPPAPEPPPVPQNIAPTLPFPEKSQRTTAEKVAAALKARGEDAEQSPFSVIVNQVYDGPLDLLLDLIRKQDIDIYDIPIAKITAQFLAYVDQLRAGDMDVAGEFIYTAALLIHIKSRMLLPRAPVGPDDAAEDPRRELVERLLEHERFKNAAQMLHEKQMLEAATWTNPGIREFQEDLGAEPEIAADTTDLVRVFSGILERARNRPILDVEEDSVTVGQMIQFLARRLTMEDKPVALRRMLSHTKSERALIAMFLALLELVRLQAILLRQDRHFSEIFIKKHTGFDALMNQGLANARDDWR
jgi:segregation and condensation protein A